MSKRNKKKLTRKQLRKRKRKMLIIEVVILLILLAVLFVWLKFGMINWDSLKGITKNDLDSKTESMLDGYTNIALFGVDNRSNGNYDSGNSDSIIIASINNETKEVKLVSVYRDSFLNVTDDTYHKCNYAYNHGGPEQAINTLNMNLDLDIEDYVAVDFNALVDAVDALGGVEIELTSEEAKVMNNSYIGEVAKVSGTKSSNVSAGLQTLDGVQATAYCRVRYTAGDDFKRTQRQRIVLTKMVEKLDSVSVSQMNKLVDAIFPEISTSLKLSQVLTLASAMKDYTLADSRGFPFECCTGTFGSKGSLVVPTTLESNVEELYSYLFGEEDYTPSKTVQSISDYIVDYTGKDENDTTQTFGSDSTDDAGD